MPNDPCFLKGKRSGDLEVETDGSLEITGQPAYLGGSRIVPQFGQYVRTRPEAVLCTLCVHKCTHNRKTYTCVFLYLCIYTHLHIKQLKQAGLLFCA